MKPLTARQQQALDIIRESVRTRSIPPTLREIGDQMGIRSTNGVDDHLQALERKGYITRSEMLSRSIRLVAPMVEAKERNALAELIEIRDALGLSEDCSHVAVMLVINRLARKAG